jgi:fumarylpyruvate hydrolase
MTDYAFPPQPVPTVAIAGTGRRFPVRRIFCVGRNYAAHAREMGKDPDREPPFFFTKPADAVVDARAEVSAAIPFPRLTGNLHHEIELTVAIGRDGADIPVERALDHVFGYASSIDLTRRDLQTEAKDMGRPREWGKAFDQSAPIVAELIWPVAEIISIVSRSMVLMPGDLVMTGTPAGVGPIVPGQTVRGGIDGLSDVMLRVG